MQANAANTNAGNVSFALGTAAGKLTLNNGGTVQLRSNTSTTFSGFDNLGGVGSGTVTFDVNNLTSGTANGNTNAGTQGQTLSAATTSGFSVHNTVINVTGGDGYTLALGPLNNTSGGSTLTLNPSTANLIVAAVTGSTGADVLTVQGAGNTTITGAISDPSAPTTFTVTKTGAGTLTLNGASTYTGATTINGGTVTLSSGATLGNTAITVNPASSGSPIFAVGGSATAGNTLTGAAGATLTLNPGTTANPSASAFTMVDNTIGTFNLTQNATFAGPALIIGGAATAGYVDPTLSFDIGGASLTNIDMLVVSGTASIGTGGGLINFSPLSTTTSLTLGNYTFITAAGGLGSNLSVAVSNVVIGGTLYSFSLANSTSTAEILTVSNTAVAPVNAYWSGGIDNNWNSQNGVTFNTNFVATASGTGNTFALPGATTNVFFTANSASNFSPANLNQAFTINSLNFTGAGTSATNGVIIASGTGGPNALTILATGAGGNAAGSGITVAAGAGADTINTNVILGGSNTWTNNSANTLTVNGAVTDSGSNFALTTAGAGTIALTGNNTYTGATTVSAGTLILSGSNSAATGPTNVTGVLQLVANAGNGGATVGGTNAAISTSSALTLNNGATLSLQSDTATTFAPASLGPFTAATYTIAVNELTGAGAGKTLSLANETGVNSGGGDATINCQQHLRGHPGI